MTHILRFSVVMLIVAVATLTAQTKPPLQAGISVEMAKTESAQPMPEADSATAWIITIDRSGTFYFKANHADFDELAGWMKSNPRDRQAKLYIKADAGVGFGAVRKALNAGRDAGFTAPVLLTSQAPSPSQEGVAPPMGIVVQVGPSAPDMVSVQMIKTNHPTPLVKINNQPIPNQAFSMMLTSVLQGQKDKTVLFKPDDHLMYSEIVHVIDECRSAGANVILADGQ